MHDVSLGGVLQSDTKCFPAIPYSIDMLPVSTESTGWYAIKTTREFTAEQQLSGECDAVFMPKEMVVTKSGARRMRNLIPHVLFIRTSHQKALDLERRSRQIDDPLTPFWIYRYASGEDIQRISDSQIRIVRLLTAQDQSQCEIFTKADFHKGQYVRVIGGFYKGYEGYVQRVKKNRHVVIEIQGICMIMLPYIHPDLLEPAEAPAPARLRS